MSPAKTTILALGLLLSAGPAGAGADHRECIDLYKRNDFESALDCWARILAAHPDDPEVHRFLGSTYARIGRRIEAYRAYNEYAERCPKCAYTPAIRKILADYEKVDPQGAQRASGSAQEPPAGPDATPQSAIRTTRTARAKAMLDKAEALLRADPDQARELCQLIQVLVGPDDPSHLAAKKLLKGLPPGPAR